MHNSTRRHSPEQQPSRPQNRKLQPHSHHYDPIVISTTTANSTSRIHLSSHRGTLRPKPSSAMATTRRIFCSQAATLLLAPRLLLSQTKPPSRSGVSAIEHARILEAATRYLTQSPTPLTALPCTRSPGTPHDF